MTSAAVRFGQRVSDFNVIGARLRDSGETTGRDRAKLEAGMAPTPNVPAPRLPGAASRLLQM
jgi:hypothetical protein